MPIIAIGLAAIIAIGLVIIAFIAIGLAIIAIGFGIAPIPIIAVGICAAATTDYRGWRGLASRGGKGQQKGGAGEGARGGGDRESRVGGGTQGRPKGASCDFNNHAAQARSSHTITRRPVSACERLSIARSLPKQGGVARSTRGAQTCIMPIIGKAGVAFGCELC